MNKMVPLKFANPTGIVFTLVAILLLVQLAYGSAVQANLEVTNSSVQESPNEDPDFSTVDDPLQGDYELFSVDDLLIQRPITTTGQTTITNYVLLTENKTVDSEQQVDVLTADCTVPGDWPQQTRIGRFFALDRDVQIILHPSAAAGGTSCSGSGNTALTIHAQVGSADAVTSTFNMSNENRNVALGDFNRDGFDDLFIIDKNQALVATARDVSDYTQGMKLGPRLDIDSTMITAYDPVTGDFNADDLLDVVWVGSDDYLHFATICPGPVDGSALCAGAAALEVVLNPLESAANPIEVPSNINCDTSSRSRALAAGNFSPELGDGLVAVYYGLKNNNCFVEATWYEFDGDLSLANDQPTAVQHVAPDDSGMFPPFPTDIFAAAAPIDWFADTEQVVVGIAMDSGATCPDFFEVRFSEVVAVITFSSNEMAVSKAQGKSTGCLDGSPLSAPLPWLNGIAVGNFATVDEDPSSESDFNLQIATMINAPTNAFTNTVRIYEVDAPTDFTPAFVSETPLTVNIPPRSGASRANWLQAGDLQGRSARLGPPTVVRVSNHSQPSVVIGAPPMHIDYVATSGEPGLFNFTTAPDAYNASYQLSTTQSTQSSSTNTTSYSYGYTETSEEKFSVGVPLVSSISGAYKQSWEQQYTDTSKNYQYKDGEFTFEMKTSTGLTDVLYYTSSEFNVYIYPVLGQTVCPSDNQNCTPDEELPLVVQFSGPESSGEVSVQGSTTEWYQPVHEPGQVFSYPWDETQLEKRMGSVPQFLSTPLSFFTGELGQSFDLEWSVGSGSEQSVGTSQAHSFETSNSFSTGEVPSEGSGLEFIGSYDYNNSSAMESLNTSSSSLSASRGVTIAKSNTLSDSGLYSYLVSAYLMGQEAPEGAVQDIEMGQAIQTYGPLQAAFTADPTANNAGAWWQDSTNPYRDYVDVALNHPSRWSWASRTGVDPSDTSCLIAAGPDYDCVAFNEPQPDDIWTSKFYWMRGLLITTGGTAGPQRNYADVGDDIFLQARVYNYSLRDMDDGSEIHVQFYRQEVKGTTPTGDSELIAEEIVAPLSGFLSPTSPDTPNWQTVTTSFEATAEMGDRYYIFWVLVWLEDGQGNLVQELPGHGLSEIPATLTSITEVPLEQIDGGQSQASGGAESETTTYSNNVGFLKVPFYIAPKSSLLAGANTRSVAGELVIQNLTIMPDHADLGQEVVISGEIFAKGGAAQAVIVHFLEHDPEHDTSAFDIENLPFIRPNEAYHFRVPHRETSCGTHRVWLVVNHGRDNEVWAKTSFVVSCLHYFPVMPISEG